MKKNNLLPIFNKDKNVMKYLTLMGQVGLVMVLSILFSFLVFYYLGKKLNILEFAMPFGILLGVFSGFYSVYKLLKKFFEEKSNDEETN